MVLVLVATIGIGLALLWGGSGADEASLDEAVERFRDRQAAGEPGFLRPAEGVYTYRGEGTEKLSILGASQEWGPTLPATVLTNGEDCWVFSIEFSTNHTQETTYCPNTHGLEEDGGRTLQRFDFGAFAVDDENVFTCDPRAETIRVDADPGDSWRQSCTGHSASQGTTVTSAGPNTFVGLEQVRVEGELVDAFHYRQDRTLTGDQTGTSQDHIWFATDNALPVKIRRDVRVESPSPLGAITYTERGTFTLESLAARR